MLPALSAVEEIDMEWKSLIESRDPCIYRGGVFRFSAKHPFEEIVDFMIIDDSEAPIGLKLICVTGHHAGKTELEFPEESKHHNGGISISWLANNWEKWIYPNCSVQMVKYIENYPSNI